MEEIPVGTGSEMLYVILHDKVLCSGVNFSDFEEDPEKGLDLVPGLQNIKKVACGENHVVSIDNAGDLWVIGANFNNLLGIPDCTDHLFTPTKIPTPSNIIQVACSRAHTLALDKNGVAWTWGKKGATLGRKEDINRPAPLAIPKKIRSIALLARTCFAVDEDDEVWIWGEHILNSDTKFKLPTKIDLSFKVASVACGANHSLALDKDGNIWCWDKNEPFSNSVPGLKNMLQVSCGKKHSLALDSEGQVWAWGNGVFGQLGIGGREDSVAPVKVVFPVDNIFIKSISCGWYFSLALDIDDTLWGWGYNNSGVLSQGDRENRLTPVVVIKLDKNVGNINKSARSI